MGGPQPLWKIGQDEGASKRMELLSVNTNAHSLCTVGAANKHKGALERERFTAGPHKETGGPRLALKGPDSWRGFGKARLRAR